MLSTFNTIVVSNDPRGRFLEGYVSGTPKPGVVMEIVAATEPVNGRFTWRVYQPGTDGARSNGGIVVLVEDRLQGKGITDAYVSGSKCFLYAPVSGDELLMQLQDVSGTADTRAIGDKYMVDSGTGTLLATTGTPLREPFVLLETLSALTADLLAHVMYTGQ
jgi:hypothetical protein